MSMVTVALCPSCKIEPAQMLKGFALMCARCAKHWRDGCDCGGHATGSFSVQHRRGCIIPGPHNAPLKR
jgi:hypothetical protein